MTGSALGIPRDVEMPQLGTNRLVAVRTTVYLNAGDNDLTISKVGSTEKPLLIDRVILSASGGEVVNEISPWLNFSKVDGARLVLGYDEDLDEDSEPAVGDFAVSVTDSVTGVVSQPTVADVDVTGMSVTLTLSQPVRFADAVTVGYTPAGSPIEDPAGNAADGFAGRRVINTTAETYDATLSALELTATTLLAPELTATTSLPLAAGVTSYSVSVDPSVSALTVTATPSDTRGRAWVSAPAEDADDMLGGHQVALGVGAVTTVTVTVVAQDGRRTVYTVEVTHTPAGLVASTVLVGNSGQSGNESATYSGDHAQAFTTGDNLGGYGVGSVTIISKDPENDPIDLKICEVDESGAPTDVCLGLTAPDSFVQGPLVFTVPDSSPLTLARDTTYVVVFKAPAEGAVRVDATSSDGEDSSSLPGWSIRNKFQWNNPNAGWQDAGGDNAIRIIISGTDMDLTDTELVVAEGATGTYTVAVATVPSADVTVTVSGQAGTDVSLSGLTSNQLTFTTGNWDTPQIVTVTAAQDPDAVDDEVTLTHTTASEDTDYAELSLDMSVTVDDDDTPGLAGSVWRTVLVGNRGQSGNESVILSSDHAQAFTTGNNPDGYGIGSVTIISEDPENDPIDP